MDTKWIMHAGGRDPDIEGDTPVRVRFADGTTAVGVMHDWDQNWQWKSGDKYSPGCIIAYLPNPLRRRY